MPFVEDLGSGAVIHTERIAGVDHEPTPAETLRRGVSLVCFSGDKLLGGPQAGIIAGKAKLIAALKREPFFRALRCDKLILAALEATVDLYLQRRGTDIARKHNAPDSSSSHNSTVNTTGIPVLDMLHVSNEDLRSRAKKIVSSLTSVRVTAAIGTGQAQLGGGALPRSAIASVTLDLAHSGLKPQELANRLRAHSVPVIGYIDRDKVRLDLRTIFPHQDAEVINAIRGLPA